MFKVYFKLAYSMEQLNNFYISEPAKNFYRKEHIKYHIAFFHAGLNAMLKMWPENDCKETPEEMADIIKSEYSEKKCTLFRNKKITVTILLRLFFSFSLRLPLSFALQL